MQPFGGSAPSTSIAWELRVRKPAKPAHHRPGARASERLHRQRIRSRKQRRRSDAGEDAGVPNSSLARLQISRIRRTRLIRASPKEKTRPVFGFPAAWERLSKRERESIGEQRNHDDFSPLHFSAVFPGRKIDVIPADTGGAGQTEARVRKPSDELT